MKLSKFMLSMAQVGCIGFGGGSALIPVLEERFIEKEKLDTKKNFDQDVIVANLTPGALPVEIAGSLGRRNFGRIGMILGAVMMAFPGAVGTLLLFTILSSAQSELLTYIKVASVGVNAFIICLLVHYIHNVMKECRKESIRRFRKAIFVMSAVFLVTCGTNVYKLLGIDREPIFAVSTFTVLLAAFFSFFYTRSDYSKKHIAITVILCGSYFLAHGQAGVLASTALVRAVEALMIILALYGAAQSMKGSRFTHSLDSRKLFGDLRTLMVFLVIFTIPAAVISREAWIYLGKGILSTLMSFGGGDAYLTIADGLFVNSGMISDSAYYGEIVTVVNILPGSILCKTLLGVGYYLGLDVGGSTASGIIFAVLGFVCSIAISCGTFSIVYYMYDSMHKSKIFVVVGRWIRPIIAGLLINIMLALLNQNKVTAGLVDRAVPSVLVFTLLLAGVDYLLMNRFKWKTPWLILINLAAAFLFLLFSV